MISFKCTNNLKKIIIFLFFFICASYLFSETITQLTDELNKDIEIESQEPIEILNVSYDSTREFYDDYNLLFSNWWKKKTGQNVTIIQSHGASGKQARAIIAGLEADVVSLALGFDIDAIEDLTGLVGNDWKSRLPHENSPYYSTIVLLVRKGNPKKIYDWKDLIRKDISIIMANPKTSGGARWGYLAIWSWALKESDDDISKAIELMKKVYANAPVLDAGARGATTTFIQRKIGDVLITWENEAYLALEKMGKDDYEIIYPKVSIKAEPPVTWLEKVIKEKKTEAVAKFYAKYLYSQEAQKLITKHYFRSYSTATTKQYPKIKMKKVSDFGGWKEVQNKHFRDNGLFDQIYLSEK